MSSVIALVLTTLLTLQSTQAQQAAAQVSVKPTIAALPANAHVAVALADGSTARGRIGNRNDQDFVLKLDNGGAPQTIAYSQVTTVEQVKERHSKAKWIVIGVVAGVLVVVAVIAVHAVHNAPGIHLGKL